LNRFSQPRWFAKLYLAVSVNKNLKYIVVRACFFAHFEEWIIKNNVAYSGFIRRL
jgi:hypothetical protein